MGNGHYLCPDMLLPPVAFLENNIWIRPKQYVWNYFAYFKEITDCRERFVHFSFSFMYMIFFSVYNQMEHILKFVLCVWCIVELYKCTLLDILLKTSHVLNFFIFFIWCNDLIGCLMTSKYGVESALYLTLYHKFTIMNLPRANIYCN